MLGSEMSMGIQAGKLRIIAVAVQVYQVIKAQRAHLPDHYFPLGWTDHTSLSSIEFFDGYVQKRVELGILDSCYGITPKDSPSPETEGVIYYAVDLEPLGVPLLSKYSDQRPKNQAELKSLTKCVLSGVQDLHNANYGHTDIRWQNIIQCGNSHRLIDLEFVCKLNQRPFTPPGYVRKARPELYSHKWVAEYDLILMAKFPSCFGIGKLQTSAAADTTDIDAVDAETNETPVRSFKVPRNHQGKLFLDGIEKALANRGLVLLGIGEDVFPAHKDGWTMNTFNASPVQLIVGPKPGVRFVQAVAYPTQQTFLRQIWQAIVA
ncbi:hypothetical protein WJX82_010385 [Trebouxia sp. C0006]